MTFPALAFPTLVRGLLALSLLVSATPHVHARVLFGSPPIDEAAAGLRPGQFVFALDTLEDDDPVPGFQSPGFPTTAPITIAVSLVLQRLYVYRGDTLVGVSTVSTGKPGKLTPMGDFTILQKRRWHRSNIYSNAPMPFMQRLTWTGIAIHAGQLPGYPASHGCIRVPLSFAQKLFGLTEVGEAVSIDDWPPHTPVYLDVEWVGVTGTPESAVPARPDEPPVLDYDFRAIGPAS